MKTNMVNRNEDFNGQWVVRVETGSKTIFEQEILGIEKAKALFTIKQVEILTSLGMGAEKVSFNPLSGEVRGLFANMPNGSKVYMFLR